MYTDNVLILSGNIISILLFNVIANKPVQSLLNLFNWYMC